MIDEWLSSPVQTDCTEQAMLNLVPFAGSWWKMANMNFKSCLVGKFLQFHLPESDVSAVTSTTIRVDHQLLSIWISCFTHHLPPTTDTLHGKRCCIVIGANIHPCLIVLHIIDPIRRNLAKFLIYEIMNLDLDRVTLGTIRFSTVLVRPNKFLFLCIHRDHRQLQISYNPVQLSA